MLRNNKGSVLVSTLMVFSIITIVCIECISLIFSNNNYLKLEYEHIRMKEQALSAIEISRSKILKEVKCALESMEDKESYEKYFLGNKFKSEIIDISKSGLKNVKIKVPGTIKIENGSINFELLSTATYNSYFKTVRVNVKIKNPYNQIIETDFYSDINDRSINTDEVNDINTYKDINHNEEYNIADTDIENIVENIFEKTKLVKIYDYRESMR